MSLLVISIIMPVHSVSKLEEYRELCLCYFSNIRIRGKERIAKIFISFFDCPPLLPPAFFFLSPNSAILQVSAFLCHMMWHIACYSLAYQRNALCSKITWFSYLPPIKSLHFWKAVWLILNSFGCYSVSRSTSFFCYSLSYKKIPLLAANWAL